MTELECYLFDLQGYIVVENALNREQIATLKQIVNQQIVNQNQPEASRLRFDSMLVWGKPFRDLIDNSHVTPYLAELLGKEFRLDHDYIHIIRQGEGPVGSFLHGGGTPYDPCQFYEFKHGKMHNGLTAVAYELNDVNPSEGGFGCVPGSHKSNYSFPREWLNLEKVNSCVQTVSVKAGSAIIFTEALTHGTVPWKGECDKQSLMSETCRTTIFYKYSPQNIAWARYYYNADNFPDLTPQQRQILRIPGIST
ncbi:phytanoyl-CoA dioxygenase family protein [Brunnivagina elsteri]|uniref:Mitomycin antibiotics/polyketide fumonisin biosynthesis protein n=1 Tax=Brunnivagina elsteri CCALA 953 TaxID=987040 RepID=A0A2A2TPN8_9CYAN|nr:phytanoyl-CoA dioxygenase family protein [Calothrix elsteri]PAX60324.1 mitomycin antibiotics/polyketide fumonisin biosynthesis protein [Calothrix elsteri CCALA 953]